MEKKVTIIYRTNLSKKLCRLSEAESHPWVLTGSTNWSFSGDNYNDENSIFIQSEKVTNLYFQEWMARYKEAGGKFTGIFDEEFSNNSTLEVSTNVIINYTVITLHIKDNFNFPFIDVVNIEGQKVASIPLRKVGSGICRTIWGGEGRKKELPSGIYFLSVHHIKNLSRKVILLK